MTSEATAELPGRTGPSRRPPRVRHLIHRARRPALVVLLLVALEVLLFGGYFNGAMSPPFDFYGSYNTEAFVWWEQGSFFGPVSWIPHAWGGYPAAVSIQNSAWYLPVGIVAALTTYDIHASAALSALHVAFGAVGVLVLARLWGLRWRTGVFGLVAFFFASGFFANAEHVDIARGYAWMPWILAVLSPRWPWTRWWAVPAGAVILWQALLTTYPGMIAAGIYAYLAFVVVMQLTVRPRLREYLLPLAVTGVAALLLLGPKYLPTFLLQGGGGDVPDESVLSWGLLGTFFFPYGNPALPNDISMRSFFLPVTCILLVGLAPFGRPLVRAAAAVAATSIVLGFPSLPWHGLLASLPALGVSRFQMSDFRAYLLLAMCVLAMTAFERLTGETDPGPAATAAGDRGGRRLLGVPGDRWSWAWPVAWITGVALVAAALGLVGPYTAEEWVPAFTLLVAAGGLVLLIAQGRLLPGPRLLPGRAGAAVVVAFTLVSGVSWAFATPVMWRAERVGWEALSYGTPVADLLASRDDSPVTQRPARSPVPEPFTPEQVVATQWNAGYYSGTDAVGGYVNLKRSQTFTTIVGLLVDPARGAAVNAFYSAPGVVVAADGDEVPPAAALERCVSASDCGPGLRVEPLEYSPGLLRYAVESGSDVPVVLNEAYYPGWGATACPTDGGACRGLEVSEGPAASVATTVPAGAWELTVQYTPPGYRLGWVAFWLGAAVCGLAAAGSLLLGRRRRGQRPEAGPGPGWVPQVQDEAALTGGRTPTGPDPLGSRPTTQEGGL